MCVSEMHVRGCRRAGSGGMAAAAGSSPGALFPAGTSPHTARKVYTPSPQQNSKWYIKVAVSASIPAVSLCVPSHSKLHLISRSYLGRSDKVIVCS